MIPSTGIPKRIGAIYNRRPTTAWSEKEIRAYRRVAHCSLMMLSEEVDLIERYYAFEKRKGDKGIYRRDLFTLLNNWNGEVDRAREWSARLQKHKAPVQPKTNGQKQSTDEDFKVAGAEAKKMIESLRASLKPKESL